MYNIMLISSYLYKNWICLEDIQGVIYKYKHQSEFKDVLDELVQHKMNCNYDVTIDMLKKCFLLIIVVCVYVVCIDISSMDVLAHEMLYIIKTETYFNSVLFNLTFCIHLNLNQYMIITNVALSFNQKHKGN